MKSQLNIRMKAPQLTRLRKMAKEAGMSQGDFIEFLMDEYQRGEPLLKEFNALKAHVASFESMLFDS